MKIKKHNEAAYINHLNRLALLFPGLDPLDTYKVLIRAENRAHRWATAACNYPNVPSSWRNPIKAYLKKKLGALPDGFFINGDPRGYALKIDDSKVPEGLHRDMGGYGILAPDFR